MSFCVVCVDLYKCPRISVDRMSPSEGDGVRSIRAEGTAAKPQVKVIKFKGKRIYGTSGN